MVAAAEIAHHVDDQHAAEDEDPFSVVMPVALGANIGGVIVSAIACGVFIATIGLVK